MVGHPSIYTLAQACSFSGGYINEHLGATGSLIQASSEKEVRGNDPGMSNSGGVHSGVYIQAGWSTGAEYKASQKSSHGQPRWVHGRGEL